jgi:hypothetical protein
MCFVGCHSALTLGKIISETIDPRYWLDSKNPDAKSKCYQKFGLLFDSGASYEQRKKQLDLSGCLRTFWQQNKGSFLDGAICDVERDRQLLEYLIAGWLDCVSQTHSGRLFVPELFFKSKKICDAYRSFTKRLIK